MKVVEVPPVSLAILRPGSLTTINDKSRHSMSHAWFFFEILHYMEDTCPDFAFSNMCQILKERISNKFVAGTRLMARQRLLPSKARPSSWTMSRKPSRREIDLWIHNHGVWSNRTIQTERARIMMMHCQSVIRRHALHMPRMSSEWPLIPLSDQRDISQFMLSNYIEQSRKSTLRPSISWTWAIISFSNVDRSCASQWPFVTTQQGSQCDYKHVYNHPNPKVM
jgi:hypothetical protein